MIRALTGGALGRNRLRRGLRGVACAAVPSAGRGRHVDGVVGLGLRREGLDREFCRRQRLGVEPLGDIVAFADGIRIALRRGQAEPFEGFGEVLFDADAAGIEDAEVELAVGDAAIGRLAEPLRRRSCSWRPCRRRRRRARPDCASPWRCRARRPACNSAARYRRPSSRSDPSRRGSRAGRSPAPRRLAPRGHTISRLRRNSPPRLCLRRSARRSRRPRSDRPSAPRRAAPVRRSHRAVVRSAAPALATVCGRPARPAGPEWRR